MVPSECIRLARLIPQPLLVVDGAGAIVLANPAMGEALGQRPAELAGRRLADLAVDPPENVRRALHFCSRAGEPVCDVLSLRKADGTAFRFPFRGLLLRPRTDGSPSLIALQHEGATQLVALGERIARLSQEIHQRKRAEASLRESEQRLRALLDATTDAVVVIDTDGVITELNDAMAERLDRARGELIGVCAYDLLPPDVVRARRAVAEEIVRTGRPVRLEDEREGRWTDSTNCPVFGERGRVVGIVVVARDTTERKRAEHALRESEAKYRELVDLNPDVVVILQDGCCRFVNEAFCKIFGYTREDVAAGLSFLELVRQADRNWVRQRYEDRLAGKGVPRHHVLDVIAKDGTMVPCETSGALIAYDSRPADMVILRDVSQRRRAEEALRQSEARLRLIAETIDDVFWITDWADHRTLFVSSAYETIWGRTAESLYQKPGGWTDAVHPDDRQRAWDALVDLEEAGAYDEEYRLIRPDGSMRWIRDRGFPVRDESGQVRHVVGIAQDVTERKRADEERRKLDARLREAATQESLAVLAGGVAHDFNNLLTGILGNADLALAKLSSASPARGWLADVLTAARAAAELCQQMLAYSGKARFVVQPVDLSALVGETAHLLEVAISKNATLRFQLPEGLPAIQADPTQMRQVVVNLASNASEALGGQGGVISVSTGAADCDRPFLDRAHLGHDLPEGLYVYLEVADTGCGMDEATRARVFDPFVTTKFTGRGLGLAAVLGIVRGHKGALTVHAEPGRGATFRVYFLAIAASAARQPAEPAQPPAARASGTILLVDDEPIVRRAAKRMLELSGFNVLTASDGREAVGVFAQRRDDIACVILDLTMPRMGGEETFDELRRLDSAVPVILSSGFGQEEIIERFAGKGIAGFVQKPYDIAALTAEIRRAMGP